mmetsp:Transcript_59572/g.158485  ORF Transcript_59572/g.158485 Transcript_59572/m.158485 type:complete len:238 (-) Transcript_59572:1149-1862(-)
MIFFVETCEDCRRLHRQYLQREVAMVYLQDACRARRGGEETQRGLHFCVKGVIKTHVVNVVQETGNEEREGVEPRDEVLRATLRQEASNRLRHIEGVHEAVVWDGAIFPRDSQQKTEKSESRHFESVQQAKALEDPCRQRHESVKLRRAHSIFVNVELVSQNQPLLLRRQFDGHGSGHIDVVRSHDATPWLYLAPHARLHFYKVHRSFLGLDKEGVAFGVCQMKSCELGEESEDLFV